MRRTVKFTHQGHSALAGTFGPGDRFTGDAEFCRHLVEEARCAEWADAPPAQQPEAAAGPSVETEQPAAPAARRRRDRKEI